MGKVTTLAPAEMVVFNPDPGQPNLYQTMSRSDRLRLFLTSLSPNQWRRLGEKNGIGVEDCAPQQQMLFLSLLPEPFQIATLTEQAEGGEHIDETHALSASERRQVRLRLNIGSLVMPSPSAVGVGITIKGGGTIRPAGATFSTVMPSGTPGQSDSQTFGVVFRASVPNQPKPSDLDDNAAVLSVPVALPVNTVSTGGTLTTVGELVRRVGQASRMELYADKRVAALPVWTHGSAASAGDLLRALCLDVCGTFRRVGPAFVLTDDVAGIGTRLAVLRDWLTDAHAQQADAMKTLRTQSLAQPLMASISFAPDDPLAGDQAILDKIVYSINHNWGGSYPLQLNSLPAQERGALTRYVDRAVQQGQSVDRNVVMVDPNLRLTYLTPTAGELSEEMPDIASIAQYLQQPYVPPVMPVKAPDLSGFPERIACVTPKTAYDVKTLAEQAHALGLTRIWIKVPTTGDKGLLSSAVKIGQRVGLPVVGVVSVLHSPPGSSSADLNILLEPASVYGKKQGNTAVGLRPPWMQAYLKNATNNDWRTPESSVIPEIAAIAAVPGLSGLVLSDTAAPGYVARDSGSLGPMAEFMSATLGEWAAVDQGYTPKLRLAFLRQTGTDPIDLVASNSAGNGVDLSLPFFPKEKDALDQWSRLRVSLNTQFMTDLYSALKAAVPTLPASMMERSGRDNWIGSWDQPSALPVRSSDPMNSTLIRQAQAISQHVLLNVPIVDKDTGPEEYLNGLNSLLSSKTNDGHWDGIVFDLSQLPVGKAMAILAECTKSSPASHS